MIAYKLGDHVDLSGIASFFDDAICTVVEAPSPGDACLTVDVRMQGQAVSTLGPARLRVKRSLVSFVSRAESAKIGDRWLTFAAQAENPTQYVLLVTDARRAQSVIELGGYGFYELIRAAIRVMPARVWRSFAQAMLDMAQSTRVQLGADETERFAAFRTELAQLMRRTIPEDPEKP